MVEKPGDGKRGVREVLDAAVEALGGQERPGQITMAEAVAAAIERRRRGA